MLVTLIPLFDENMMVCAYSLFTQKKNYFLNPRLAGTGENDGKARVEGLEMIKSIGINNLSINKEVFVPLNNISIFSNVEEQCEAPHGRIVFLIDNTVPPEEMYIKRIKELKERGYRFAVRKLEVKQYQEYEDILSLMEYMFYD